MTTETNTGGAPAKNLQLDKTEVLPSGVVAVIRPFKGKHIMEAQKIAGTNTELYLPALIALTTTFDGKEIVAEDVAEMPGWDVLKLMTLFSGDGKNF